MYSSFLIICIRLAPPGEPAAGWLEHRLRLGVCEGRAELGDILWFLTALCRDLDTSIGEVATLNIQKLSKRAAKGTLQGSGDDR